MPRTALKRQESLVKFVRRAARGHLAAADAALRAAADGGKRGPAAAGRARRELLRLRALLRLVRGPLGAAAFGREHRAVERLIRRIAPHAAPADNAALRRDLGREPAEGAARSAAGPALLRALADLAEVRVRAAHWHLPEAGFEALAPALRSAWRQAVRPVTGGQGTLSPAALSDAALTLHDQLRCIERVWPEAIDAPRQLARSLAAAADRLAGLDALAAEQPGEDGGRPDRQLADARAVAVAEVAAGSALLRAETPAAFTRRVAAYWGCWRGATG